MSPHDTWEAIREDVAAVSAMAAMRGFRMESIAPEDFITWHRCVFQRTFPGRCGILRDHEEDYGYVVGTPESPITKVGHGTGWRRVPKRLGEVCDEFNRDAVRLDSLDATHGLKLADATRAAARLYAKFLSIHPFEDGNGRVGYVVLSYALVRVQTMAVELPDYAELQWALGRALQPGGKGGGTGPLAALLATKIRDSHAQDLS